MPDTTLMPYMLLLPGELPAKHSLQRLEYLVIVAYIQDKNFPLLEKMRRTNPKDFPCPYCAAIT